MSRPIPSAAAHPKAQAGRPLSRRTELVVAMGIFIAVFLTFARSIGYGFSDFDDVGFVLEADGYRGLGVENLRWMFTAVRLGHYQPLTYLSYAIDYVVWGLDPRGFHATNVVIHSCNAVLVYLLAVRLMRACMGEERVAGPLHFGAAMGALVYGMHPQRVEAAVWITERRDVLSGFFLLLASLAYLRAFPVGSVRPATPRWYWASVALLLASVLSKAWGMTFFVVLLALDVYPLRRLSARPWRWGAAEWRVAAQKVPYLLIGMGTAVMAASAQRAAFSDTVVSLDRWGVGDRAVQAAYGLVYYVRKMAWPTDLCVFCELPRSVNPLGVEYLAVYAALLVGVVAIVLVRKKAPGLALALACYVVVVSPVLGVLQSGPQFVADRYSYLANIGWSVVLGVGAMWLMEKAGRGGARTLVLAAGGMVLVALAGSTWKQIGTWSTDERLFGHAIESGWDGPLLRRYYGAQLEKRGDKHAAREQYQRSLAMHPENGESWLYLGNVERDGQRWAEALAAYDKAAGFLREPSGALVAKGLLLVRLDRAEEAVAPLRAGVEAIERAHGTGRHVSGRAYMALAGALDLSGKTAASREVLWKAAERADTREEALGILREMDAESREGK